MNNDIKALRILTMALMAGVFIFSIISFAILKINAAPMAADLNPVIMYAGVVIAVGLLPFAFISFNKDSAACAATDDDAKLQIYRAAIIKQFAFFEGAALFNVIAYLLGGNIISIGLALLTLLLMMSQTPTEEKFNRFG